MEENRMNEREAEREKVHVKETEQNQNTSGLRPGMEQGRNEANWDDMARSGNQGLGKGKDERKDRP